MESFVQKLARKRDQEQAVTILPVLKPLAAHGADCQCGGEGCGCGGAEGDCCGG